MSGSSRQFLRDLFDCAVAAAHPAGTLPALLPPPPKGRLIMLAAGKGAGSMSDVAEQHYFDTLKFPAARLAVRTAPIVFDAAENGEIVRRHPLRGSRPTAMVTVQH